MTYESWVTAGLFIAAVLFLASDIPVKPKSEHRLKSKRRV